LETEADVCASELLIPAQVWKRSSAYRERTVEAVLQLAEDLSINPAIVVGRLRRDTNNFRLHSSLLGYRQVRRLFPLS